MEHWQGGCAMWRSILAGLVVLTLVAGRGHAANSTSIIAAAREPDVKPRVEVDLRGNGSTGTPPMGRSAFGFPDERETSLLWNGWWYAHHYSFGLAFFLLTVASTVGLLLLQTGLLRDSVASKPVLVCLVAVGACRIILLLVDPYGSRRLVPAAIAQVLEGISLPGFLSSYALLLSSLVKATKPKGPLFLPFMHTPLMYAVLSFLVFLYMATVVLVYGYGNWSTLLLICEASLITLGLILGVYFLVLGYTTVKQMNLIASKAQKTPGKPREVILHVCTISSCLLLFFSGFYTYVITDTVNSRTVFERPWPWLICATALRFLETCMYAHLLHFVLGNPYNYNYLMSVFCGTPQNKDLWVGTELAPPSATGGGNSHLRIADSSSLPHYSIKPYVEPVTSTETPPSSIERKRSQISDTSQYMVMRRWSAMSYNKNFDGARFSTDIPDIPESSWCNWTTSPHEAQIYVPEAHNFQPTLREWESPGNNNSFRNDAAPDLGRSPDALLPSKSSPQLGGSPAMGSFRGRNESGARHWSGGLGSGTWTDLDVRSGQHNASHAGSRNCDPGRRMTEFEISTRNTPLSSSWNESARPWNDGCGSGTLDHLDVSNAQSSGFHPVSRSFDASNRRFDADHLDVSNAQSGVFHPVSRSFDAGNRRLDADHLDVSNAHSGAFHPVSRSFDAGNRRFNADQLDVSNAQSGAFHPASRSFDASNRRFDADQLGVSNAQSGAFHPASRSFDAGNRRFDTDHLDVSNAQSSAFHPSSGSFNAGNRNFDTDNRRFGADSRRFGADNRRVDADNRRVDADNRRFDAGRQRFDAGSRSFNAGNRSFEAENRRFGAGNWSFNAGNPTPGFEASTQTDGYSTRFRSNAVSSASKRIAFDDMSPKNGHNMINRRPSVDSEILATRHRAARLASRPLPTWTREALEQNKFTGAAMIPSTISSPTLGRAWNAGDRGPSSGGRQRFSRSARTRSSMDSGVPPALPKRGVSYRHTPSARRDLPAIPDDISLDAAMVAPGPFYPTRGRHPT